MMEKSTRWFGLAMVAALLIGTRLPADEPKVEGDLKAMQGEWIQKAESGDEVVYKIVGSKMSVKSPKRSYEITIKIDPKAKPTPTIDVKVDKGPEDAEGKSMIGIYKIDGDAISLCLGGEKRPTEFKQDFPESFLFELKRKK